MVFGERSLHRYLTAYADYYHRWRTHLALGKDAPEPRRPQSSIEGRAIELSDLGGPAPSLRTPSGVNIWIALDCHSRKLTSRHKVAMKCYERRLCGSKVFDADRWIMMNAA